METSATSPLLNDLVLLTSQSLSFLHNTEIGIILPLSLVKKQSADLNANISMTRLHWVPVSSSTFPTFPSAYLSWREWSVGQSQQSLLKEKAQLELSMQLSVEAGQGSPANEPVLGTQRQRGSMAI